MAIPSSIQTTRMRICHMRNPFHMGELALDCNLCIDKMNQTTWARLGIDRIPGRIPFSLSIIGLDLGYDACLRLVFFHAIIGRRDKARSHCCESSPIFPPSYPRRPATQSSTWSQVTVSLLEVVPPLSSSISGPRLAMFPDCHRPEECSGYGVRVLAMAAQGHYPPPSISCIQSE